MRIFSIYLVDILKKHILLIYLIDTINYQRTRAGTKRKGARGVKIMAEQKRPDWKTEWIAEGGKTSEVINHIHASIFSYLCSLISEKS